LWYITDIPIQASLTFEPVEGATRLTFVANVQFAGLFQLLEPLVIRMVSRQLEADYQNLKELLEAPAQTKIPLALRFTAMMFLSSSEVPHLDFGRND
jgi:hypothetical protein